MGLYALRCLVPQARNHFTAHYMLSFHMCLSRTSNHQGHDYTWDHPWGNKSKKPAEEGPSVKQ